MTHIKLFQDFLSSDNQEIEQFLFEDARQINIKKGDCLIHIGEVQTHLSFLVSGVLRGYVIDENGLDVTDCFAYHPGDAIIGCNGFDEPSLVSFEALADCELIQVPMRSVFDVITRYPQAMHIYTKLLQQALKRHWSIKRVLYQPAMQRYLWFLDTYPGLIDCVSNKYIAMFLGITPVTLSRLRRRLREEDDIL